MMIVVCARVFYACLCLYGCGCKTITAAVLEVEGERDVEGKENKEEMDEKDRNDGREREIK